MVLKKWRESRRILSAFLITAKGDNRDCPHCHLFEVLPYCFFFLSTTTITSSAAAMATASGMIGELSPVSAALACVAVPGVPVAGVAAGSVDSGAPVTTVAVGLVGVGVSVPTDTTVAPGAFAVPLPVGDGDTLPDGDGLVPPAETTVLPSALVVPVGATVTGRTDGVTVGVLFAEPVGLTGEAVAVTGFFVAVKVTYWIGDALVASCASTVNVIGSEFV